MVYTSVHTNQTVSPGSMMPQLKASLRPPAKTKTVVVRVSPEDYDLLRSKSMRWAAGSLSTYLREAGKNWTPSKDALTAPDR